MYLGGFQTMKRPELKPPKKVTGNFKSTQSAQLLEIVPLEKADVQEHKLAIRRDLL